MAASDPVPALPAEAERWGERAWDALAHMCLRQDRGGRIVGVERGRRVDAWTLSQILAVAQIRALVEPAGWAVYDGLVLGLADHLYRDVGYRASHRRGGPEVYYDDNAWLGLTAVGAVLARAQDGAALSPEVWRDLGRARLILRLLRQGEDPTRGGVLWRVGGETRNACSTGPAALLALRVVEAERVLGVTADDHDDQREFALRCARFLDRLVGESGMVRDHERADGSVDPSVYSYNQGTAIGLRVQLARAGLGDGPRVERDRARALARAAIDRYAPGDETSRLWRDCPAFGSILCRNLLSLWDLDGDARWLRLTDTWRWALERSARDRAGRYVRGGVATYERMHALDTAGVAYVHWARQLPARLYALFT